MKRLIEKYCINKMYLSGFPNHGRINRHKKWIIFHPNTWIFYKIFMTDQQKRCFWALKYICGYSFFEVPWCPWAKQNQPQSHTWGEIQDIIRAYRSIPPAPPVIGLSDKVSNLDSSEPKSDVLPVTPSDN